MPITQFGAYDFTRSFIKPADQSSNFGEKVGGTLRLPYMDGAFRVFGTEPSPSEAGNIQVSFTLVSATREGMQALRDELLAINGYGLAKLYYRPFRAAQSRFCEAEATVRMAMRHDAHTDLFQPVTINFSVPYPRWLVKNGTTPFQWGDPWGTPWGTPAVINASGLQTDSILVQGGNADSLTKITIAPGPGQLCENPVVQRLVNGFAVDEFSYTGTLTDSDSLEMDRRAGSVKLNGSSVATFDFRHKRWLVLKPGDNTLRIGFDNDSDAAAVTFEYFDTYYGE